MNIEITSGFNSEEAEWEEMSIDGKPAMSVYPLYDCPEDAIIGRSLTSCTEVVELMEKAYEAGKNGEIFMVTELRENK